MKFMWKEKEWYINDFLSTQLDTITYNIKKDWDFVILITGDRMVRVGKSIIAMTVCAYLAYRFAQLHTSRDKGYSAPLNKDAYNMSNLFFDNKDMVEASFKKEKYSVIHYDEGREGLAANKAMQQVQKDLVDFFTECGQMNHCFVIVAPDFFDLKEMMAVSRSEILINVYRKSENKMMDIYKEGVKKPVTVFSRGHFEFFSKKKKAQLYDNFRTTRRKWYGAVKCDFLGDFTDQYPLGEEEYKAKKREALARFQDRHKEEKPLSNKVVKVIQQRSELVNWLKDEYNIPIAKISKRLGLTPKTLYNSLVENDDIRVQV